MHLSGYLFGVLFGLTALHSTLAQSINTNTTNALYSSLNRLLQRKGTSSSSRGGGGRGSTSGGRGASSSPKAVVKSSSSLVHEASAYSEGGGSSWRLPSNSRFPTRWVGGGRRDHIYGTSRFGSGLESADAQQRALSVGNANFPFGFWPIAFPDGYCGTSGYEYPSSKLNDTRPGGELIVVDIQPDPADGQISAEEKNHTYYMIGDKESVRIVMDILVSPKNGGGCQSIRAYPANWTLSTVSKDRLEPGHVLQWYRSSSFALAYTGYNNSYAYPPLNTTTPLGASDSLPSALLASVYLPCLNKTIGAALPIMNAEDGLSSSAIWGIIVGSIIGFFLLLCAIGILRRCCSATISRLKDANREVKASRYHFEYPRQYRGSDHTLVNLNSQRPSTVSDLRSPPASTRSLSPTLHSTSIPPSPVLGPRASLKADLPSNSQEPDGAASRRSRSSFGHRYDDYLTEPVSPHFGSRDRSSRMSVSSERSHSPSPWGQENRLLR